MSVTVTGVPASIGRKQVLELLRTLGFDPSEMVSVRFERNGIFAEVYADGSGDHTGHTERWRFTADGENAATHVICIPITDGENHARP